jgi:hypothetical protein
VRIGGRSAGYWEGGQTALHSLIGSADWIGGDQAVNIALEWKRVDPDSHLNGSEFLRFGGRTVGLLTALGVAQANAAARRSAAISAYDNPHELHEPLHHDGPENGMRSSAE